MSKEDFMTFKPKHGKQKRNTKNSSVTDKEVSDIDARFCKLNVKASPVNEYLIQLKAIGSFYQLRNDHYIVRDADTSGQLKSAVDWIQLHASLFLDENETPCKVLICACKDSAAQREALEATDMRISISANHFKKQVEDQYCIHAQTLDVLLKNDRLNTPNDSDVVVLSVSPYMATAVLDEGRYGVVTKGRSEYKCSCKVIDCNHIEYFLRFCSQNDIELPEFRSDTDTKQEEFSSRSHIKIPYPYTEKMRVLNDMYSDHKTQLPEYCLPPPPAKNQRCDHGNRYDPGCPAENGWIKTRDACIHTHGRTQKGVTVCYRPTIGSCKCELVYDGQEDLLFNLDNKNLFFYGFLISIMHSTQNCQFTLMAAWKNDDMARRFTGKSAGITYAVLRKAYNAFIRLLDLDYTDLYDCEVCAENVVKERGMTVIMDGIMMGSRRDLYPPHEYSSETLISTRIKGSSFKERLMIPCAKTRALLAKYTGLVQGTYIRPFETMEDTEFQLLCSMLKKSCQPVHNLVASIGKNIDPGYRHFLGELSRSSPLCGVFQFCGDEEVIALLKEVEKGTLKLKNTKNMEQLSILQSRVPILCEAILAATPLDDGDVKPELRKLIPHIIKCVCLPDTKYKMPSDDEYEVPSDERYDWFPNFPRIRVRPSYPADKPTQKPEKEEDCRKLTQSHKSLTPGIFTIFCEHKICLGFSLMQEVESPQTPFNIFLERFPQQVLDQLRPVYDNCCKLQNYCLKREPKRFSKTRFQIDRLHFNANHIGCTDGYSLDQYKANTRLVKLNSQINEQANSVLRRLATQVTYMTPSNVLQHTGLFLGLRNLYAKAE